LGAPLLEMKGRVSKALIKSAEHVLRALVLRYDEIMWFSPRGMDFDPPLDVLFDRERSPA